MAAALLAVPAVLAFFSGGFFDKPRLIAGIGVWLALAAAVLAGGRPWPRSGPGRAVTVGLGLLAGWILLSLTWAPLADGALDDGQRVLLYLGYLLLAVVLLRPRPAARLVEPILAAGAIAAVAYGLSARLLPQLVEQQTSQRAFGRLDQPLTYWNAMGALAAIGLVLCARLAGDATRPRALRILAAAGAAPLGAGLYLTFSRGAIAAAALGLAVLAALVRSRAELGAAILATLAAAAGAISVAFLPDVADPPAAGASTTQGAAGLGLLIAVAGAAALLNGRLGTGEKEAGSPAPLRRAALAIIPVVVLAALAATTLSGERVSSTGPAGAHPNRLRSVESQRYDYWKVAASTFADHPLRGVGSAGYKVEWRRERPAGLDPVADAHSLYMETAAELGLVGLALLGLLLAGVVLSARRALGRDRTLAAGPVAALSVWALHAGLDWDWEMPALGLQAVALAAVLVAAAESPTVNDATEASTRRPQERAPVAA
jgi:hypothetical protein